MVLNMDLNFPPVEGTSGQMTSQVSPAESSKGLVGSPIDVEAIEDYVDDDDELKLLPSSATFPQWRNRTRRNRQVTVDLEAPTEIPPAQTGIGIVDPAAILLSLSGHTTTERMPTTNTNIINHHYVDLEGINYKWKNTTPRAMKAPLLLAKEPTFTCPLCLEPLKNPCSTVCGHIFCQMCIETCIASTLKERKGRSCPTCRSKLPAKKSFHRVYLPNAD